jgi:hypothetical protein
MIMRYIFLASVLLLAVFSLAGCSSPQEKRGVSPLPQNRPQEWETKPYGDLKN